AHPRVVRVFKGHTHAIEGLALSRDGHWLASCGDQGTVRLWDVATGKVKHTLTGHKGMLFAVVFSPDGKHLASAGFDTTVRLWSVADGKSTAVLTGHTRPVQSLAWSPDGKTLASCGHEGDVRLWNPDGKLRAKLVRQEPRSVGLAFSADSRKLLAGNDL